MRHAHLAPQPIPHPIPLPSPPHQWRCQHRLSLPPFAGATSPLLPLVNASPSPNSPPTPVATAYCLFGLSEARKPPHSPVRPSSPSSLLGQGRLSHPSGASAYQGGGSRYGAQWRQSRCPWHFTGSFFLSLAGR
jgi:hypothetical protein